MLFKNLVSVVIIAALLVLMGLIFMGVRLMLVSFYDSWANLQSGFLSMPHFVAYLVFFLVVDVFRIMATDFIISQLIVLRNPPTDEHSRQLSHRFQFYYLLGIELIAPFFFLILEPIQGTTCYSSSCVRELSFYVYARYLIILGETLLRTVKLFWDRSKSKLLSLFS